MFATSFTPSPPPYPLSPLSPLIPPHTTSMSSPSALHNSSSSSTSSPLRSSAVKKESGLDFNFDDPLSSSTKIVVTFNHQTNSFVKSTEPVRKKSPPKSNISCTPALPKVQLKRLDFNELTPSPLSPNRFCVKDSAFDISSEQQQRHHLRPVLPFNPYSSEKFVHGRRTKKQSSSKKRQNAKNVKNEKWTRKLKPNC